MTIVQKQCLLKFLGYYSEGVDGKWGPASRKAASDFSGDFPEGEFEENLRRAVAEKQEKPGDVWAEAPNFRREEFRCKCGGKYCGGFPYEPDPELVRIAQELRDHFGVPITVSSGVRCPTHNANVGGVADSRHLEGKAMDFSVRGQKAETVLAFVQLFPGIRYAYAIDSFYVHMNV